MTIIYFILIISAIIIIHELGHLLTAKYFHVYCEEFSIGMGPAIFKKKFSETTFAIRALPIGGFVAMAGEEGMDNEDIPFERTIKGIAWWKQIIVMGAGALMNILLAWILFIGITMVQGKVVVPAEPVVQGFTESSVAQEAGIQVGDRIVSVSSGGATIHPKTFDDIIEHMGYYPDSETTFEVERNQKQLTFVLTPRYNEAEDRYLAGFLTKSSIKDITALEAISYGTDKMIDGSKTIVRALGKLVQGIGLQNLSGPVGIYKLTEQTTQIGMTSTLSLIALLSLNIGIFNLIPLPVLDGGRIFIILLEKISGRKISEKVETAIMSVGVLLLIGIMVFATWQDIMRLF